jgi:DNA-directed RNA polymerase subunit RPC12/RpoP
MADEEKKDEKIQRGPKTQIVYECAVCQNTYDHPGMCQACRILLKPRGE